MCYVLQICHTSDHRMHSHISPTEARKNTWSRSKAAESNRILCGKVNSAIYQMILKEKIRPSLTPTGMRWGDGRSSPKTLQCGHVKRVVWGRPGRNSSAAIWEARWQLTQMLDCSYCGRGWNNRWLSAGGNYVPTKGGTSSRRNCVL